MQALSNVMLTTGINFFDRGQKVAGFELANVGRTDMREDIKLKVAKNARSMVVTPSLVTGMPLTSNGFESICTRDLGLSLFLLGFRVNALH